MQACFYYRFSVYALEGVMVGAVIGEYYHFAILVSRKINAVI